MPWVLTTRMCKSFKGPKCNGVIIQILNRSLVKHLVLPGSCFGSSPTHIWLHLFSNSNLVNIKFWSIYSILKFQTSLALNFRLYITIRKPKYIRTIKRLQLQKQSIIKMSHKFCNCPESEQ